MSTLPLVIVNPTSAGGATARRWPRIASCLREHFGAFTPVFTETSGDATAIAAREAQAGRAFIIACGGDGTINEVANGILESGADAELGVLPSGTGGDFRRTLKMPSDAAAAARALLKGSTRRIDVGRATFINHDGAQASKYFLGVASFGMSGEVIKRVKASGKASSAFAPGFDLVSEWLGANWLGGKLSFALATLQETLTAAKTNVRVQIDDQPERRLTIANFCIANARYFGGGMKIAPAAKLNDGRFDIVAIGDLSALKILANAPRLYLGAHLGMSQVHHALAKRITAQPINEHDEVLIETDGELPGRLPATFEILPQALRVRANVNV